MLDWSSYSETASPSHILVIVSGIAAGLVLTVLLVCLFVTCRRKVSCWLWILKRWQTMFPKSLVRRLGPFWFLCLVVLAVFLENWCLYPRNVYRRFDLNGPCSIDQILLKYYLSQVGFMDRQRCPRERPLANKPEGVYRGLRVLSKASLTWKDSSDPCKPTSGVFPRGLSLGHHWRSIVYMGAGTTWYVWSWRNFLTFNFSFALFP